MNRYVSCHTPKVSQLWLALAAAVQQNTDFKKQEDFNRNCLKLAGRYSPPRIVRPPLGHTRLAWQKFVVHRVVGLNTSALICLFKDPPDSVGRLKFESESHSSLLIISHMLNDMFLF